MQKTSAEKKATRSRRNSPQRDNVAFVGLGDMGLPMAKNLLRAGFGVAGFDLSPRRLSMLRRAGGKPSSNCRECAEGADVAFVMVMNGAQVMEAIAGKNGLLKGMRPGGVIVITATIERREVQEAADVAAKRGVRVVDSPVSGGMPGARDGRLIFMAAGPAQALNKARPFLDAMGRAVHVVGRRAGDGQTVKAALQAMLGGMFAAIFEASVLGRKAGIKSDVLFKVLNDSSGACPILANCSKLIAARKFKDTGSRIATMYKDIGISTGLAREVGAPLFVAAAARELFQAGISCYPDEDNWAVVKVLERMAGLPSE